ncbi:MAG: SDR family oxidoreductase [Deltaproteobacteria bacterium]|nr:SDR family oxidoreductase [Deltaproteobacteria bacterium]
MIDLNGKRALVTGAGVRVGAAIATELGRRGMTVALHYHSSDAGARETAKAIEAAGGQAALFQADLSDPSAAAALARRVTADLGGLEVLVPSAANFENVALDDIDDGHWERALMLNLRAPFELARAAAPALRASRGAIVFITGFGTEVPYTGYLPYLASKGALRQVMRTLALELAPEVRVNAVAPGTVLPPEDMTAEATEALVSKAPLRKVGAASDVAEAVAYLASAPYVTGQQLLVDGGRSVAST